VSCKNGVCGHPFRVHHKAGRSCCMDIIGFSYLFVRQKLRLHFQKGMRLSS